MADHRVEQIFQAVKTTLEGDGTFSVYREPLDALTGELSDLPGSCIWAGEEEPRGDTGYEVMGAYSGAQVVYVDVWDQAASTVPVGTKLNELRKKVHIALMQSSNLGLSFVFNVVPAGSDEPELSAEGSAITGKLRTNWIVEYRTDVTDPSA